jgi:hypothetical protein
MFAAFIMIFVLVCITGGALSLIGSAMDRTTTSRRNRYHMPFDRHDDLRKVERNGFKSRAGIR